MIEWLRQHMLECFFAQQFGVPCPGCGIQRSFLLLLEGEVWASIKMYPPLFPTLFILGFLAVHLVKGFERGGVVLRNSFILTVLLMIVNFFTKL